MSLASSPLPPAHSEQDPSSPADDPPHAITRTVAIIKTHALEHRLDIEPRIYEAGFEIVKERQMEFDMETDPDVLYELFGEDAGCFSEGPVWVYVLERPRAIEAWKTLMGHPDPEIARQLDPRSLRAHYGISPTQNGLMGSPDTETAEIQIASLFVSSPPFPATDFQDESNPSSRRSVTAAALAELQDSVGSSNGYAPSSITNPSTGGRQVLFKARSIPSTHHQPDIVPRTTKAAALRAGIVLDKPRRIAPTKESLAKTFENVPGHKRTESIQVASTAPPKVAPRMTRAAALRLGLELSPTQKKPTKHRPGPSSVRKPNVREVTETITVTSEVFPQLLEATSRMAIQSSLVMGLESRSNLKITTVRDRSRSSSARDSEVFEGVPGHKRRETFSVASTKAPVVAPRTNRSAMLRLQKEVGPPSSFRGKPPTLTRSPSQLGLNGSNPRTPSRPSSATAIRSAGPESTTNGNNSSPLPEKAKPRPSSIMAPSIAPRSNKSAELRAAKKAASASISAGKTPRKNIPAFF